MYWGESGFAVLLLEAQGPCPCAGVHTLTGRAGNDPFPALFPAGYGAPYGYSTAAPAYGTYSPVINVLQVMQKLLWQSKCGSPRRNSKRFKLLNHDNDTTFMP